MVICFYVFVVEQIAQGLYSLWQGIIWLRMVRRRAGLPASLYTPKVALFCPVKGLEPGLEKNLLALTAFDYRPYEIFFAVASAQDPAYHLLERIAAASPRIVHVVHAGPARDCTEKVHNLRIAVEQAGAEFDVFVFTDSDGRPPKSWLRRMVAPLADDRLGAATTFRWLIPSASDKREEFWSALASAWNAPIATYLGEHQNNFCWGGGMAIRRERFEETHVAEAWQRSASDDFSLTRAVNAGGFRIAFVPECLVPSFVQFNARSLFEFTARQFIITRVYAPKLWLTAGIAHFLYCAAVLMGLFLWLSAWSAGLPSLQFRIMALIPPALCALRGVQRLMAIVEVLPEERAALLSYSWGWTVLAPLVPFLSLYNSIVPIFRRQIVWRGRRYYLASPAETRILPP